MQARYILPPAIKVFTAKYPQVRLSIHQGSPRDLANGVIAGEADIAVATETLDRFSELVTEPLYRWHHCVVVPKNHPLTQERKAHAGPHCRISAGDLRRGLYGPHCAG